MSGLVGNSNDRFSHDAAHMPTGLTVKLVCFIAVIICHIACLVTLLLVWLLCGSFMRGFRLYKKMISVFAYSCACMARIPSIGKSSFKTENL